MDDIANDFSGFQTALQSALVATTRQVSRIASQDIEFHRCLDQSVSDQLDRQNARLLALAERLLVNAAASTATATGTAAASSSGSAAASSVDRPAGTESQVHGLSLPDLDSIDTNWRVIVDAVDSLLEKADISIDEYTGAVKRLSPSRDSTPSRGVSGTSSAQRNSWRSANILKPQRLFEHPPDNFDTSIFKPLLKHKPYAAVPLEQSLFPVTNDKGVTEYPHPYRQEIQNYQYPSSVYTRAEPIPYNDFDSTTATFVDTEEAMLEMLEELKQATEIAVDLEHHDTRSYIGMVSLMQISTRSKDWVVDTLKPWRRKLQCLNEVFANPDILKVLHGAKMDVVWLQRDLGIYIVGLFDTHHASKVLNYQGGSLAFLLKKFVDIEAQKQYQTADWRIRPLPQALLDYARSDTHYLLYIYDNMRNELIRNSHLELPDHQGDLLHEVLQRSKHYALQIYVNDLYDSERGLGARGWYNMVWKSPALLNKVQFAVFRAVHKWRDTVAREQDDGLHHVMPNWNIFSLAREMPNSQAALLGICQPPTEIVRFRADELLAVIESAKAQGESAREMYDILGEIDVHLHGERRVSAHGTVTADKHASATERERGTGPVTCTKSIDETRSTTSSFWGAILKKPSGLRGSCTTSLAAPHLSVPLPPLTAEIFADPTTRSETAHRSSPNNPPPASPPLTATATAKPEADAIFTLKQRNANGTKTNNTSSTDSYREHDQQAAAQQQQRQEQTQENQKQKDNLAANADILSMHSELATDDNPEALNKEARRLARKARKAAKRAASSTTLIDSAATGAGAGAVETTSRPGSARAAKRTSSTAAMDEDGDVADDNAEVEDPLSRRNEDPMQEFDYANAQSVLNASSLNGGGAGGAAGHDATRKNKKRKKNGGEDKIAAGASSTDRFDPFAKALDAPKGLPRAQRERVGKSMTFKN